MGNVELILPKDISYLEKKCSEVLSEIVAARLSPEDLEYLISELESQEMNESANYK